jgi:hypothetical protein
MEPSAFRSLLERYPKVRDGRTYVAARNTICRLAGTVDDSDEPAEQKAAVLAPVAAVPPKPSSATASIPVVQEFWGGLNELIKTLAAERATGSSSSARLKAQMLLEKKTLAAFEDLHFSLLRESNYEEVEGVLALVAAAAAEKRKEGHDGDEGFETPRAGTPTA